MLVFFKPINLGMVYYTWQITNTHPAVKKVVGEEVEPTPQSPHVVFFPLLCHTGPQQKRIGPGSSCCLNASALWSSIVELFPLNPQKFIIGKKHPPLNPSRDVFHKESGNILWRKQNELRNHDTLTRIPDLLLVQRTHYLTSLTLWYSLFIVQSGGNNF